MTSRLSTIYNKLTDLYNQPKAIDGIEDNSDITILIGKIKEYQQKKCGPIDQQLSCKITDSDINNISKFLAHVIPLCPQTDITLLDIKNGKILSKGAFGYGFSAGNSVIKIVICNDINNIRFSEQIANEINIHKFLTLINMDIFTILKGYFIRNNNTYEYYNYYNRSNRYELLEHCNFNLKFDKICETYLLLEKGEYDLEKVVDIIKNVPNKAEQILNLNIVDKFEKLLTIYKTVFKMNGIVFIHSDIKTSNIVVVSDKGEEKYKFIDFGTSFISDKFFNKAVGGTPVMFKILIFDKFIRNQKDLPNDIIISPLYDIFCILNSLFEICIGRQPVNMEGIKGSVLKFLSEHPYDDIYKEQKQKLYRMFYLLEMINDFYSNVMEEYIKIIHTTPIPINVIELFDMENFKFIERDYFKETGLQEPKPIYKKIHFYKLKNDVMYLDDIMCYLFDEIEKEVKITF